MSLRADVNNTPHPLFLVLHRLKNFTFCHHILSLHDFTKLPMCFPKLQQELVFTPKPVNLSKESKPPRAFFIWCRDRCVMWTDRNCWYVCKHCLNLKDGSSLFMFIPWKPVAQYLSCYHHQAYLNMLKCKCKQLTEVRSNLIRLLVKKQYVVLTTCNPQFFVFCPNFYPLSNMLGNSGTHTGGPIDCRKLQGVHDAGHTGALEFLGGTGCRIFLVCHLISTGSTEDF